MKHTVPLRISAFTLSTALGHGAAASPAALQQRRSGLRPCDYADVDSWIGRVAGLEDTPLPAELAAFECRNHRLARAALETDGSAVAAARARYGTARIGVFIGTSTSGIRATKIAYAASARPPPRRRYLHNGPA